MGYKPGDRIGEYIHAKYENYKRFGLARAITKGKERTSEERVGYSLEKEVA